MLNTTTISCPVSAERINENVARAVSFYVILISATGTWLNSYIIMFLLAADYALRAFTNGKASPLKILSKKTVQLLNIPEKSIDAAPKKFAAGLGMVFCLASATFMLLNLFTAAIAATGVLIFCCVLESAAAICLGCITYALVVLPFTKKP